jgi:hypothetical protein
MALTQPPGMMRGMTLAPPYCEAIAAEALAAIDDARQIAPFSAHYPGLTLDDAYRISARLCTLRTARGERVIGRKIGFTNRMFGPNMRVRADVGIHVRCHGARSGRPEGRTSAGPRQADRTGLQKRAGGFCLPRSLASCCGGYPARSLVVALGLGRSIFVPKQGPTEL